MMKRESGYSLIELLIVLAILGFVLAAGSDMFVSTLQGYKQQSKIAETNIEGMIGLEMLRRDLENAGYGLPHAFPGGILAYNEAAAANATAAFFNDSTAGAPPRAILSGDNIIADPGIVSGSDYLVLKAANLARNDECARWNYLMTDGTMKTNISTTNWVTSGKENFGATVGETDRVIVLSPGTDANNTRTLVVFGGNYFTTFNNLAGFNDAKETRIIYGVSNTDLRMPFNRADYYVSSSPALRPGRCAPGTGVLVKAIVNQSNGSLNNDIFPLLDCVADMQVVAVTTNGPNNGYIPLDAKTLRDQLQEVRVYILAQEGQRDTKRNVTYTGNVYRVGPVGDGRNFPLNTIANYQNYRWKLYTIIVRPNNLR